MPRIPNQAPFQFSARLLREQAAERGMTERKIAMKLFEQGLTTDLYVVKGYFHGKKSPSVPVLYAIAKAIGCHMEDMIDTVEIGV